MIPQIRFKINIMDSAIPCIRCRRLSHNRPRYSQISMRHECKKNVKALKGGLNVKLTHLTVMSQNAIRGPGFNSNLHWPVTGQSLVCSCMFMRCKFKQNQTTHLFSWFAVTSGSPKPSVCFEDGDHNKEAILSRGKCSPQDF